MGEENTESVEYLKKFGTQTFLIAQNSGKLKFIIAQPPPLDVIDFWTCCRNHECTSLIQLTSKIRRHHMMRVHWHAIEFGCFVRRCSWIWNMWVISIYRTNCDWMILNLIDIDIDNEKHLKCSKWLQNLRNLNENKIFCESTNERLNVVLELKTQRNLSILSWIRLK